MDPQVRLASHIPASRIVDLEVIRYIYISNSFIYIYYKIVFIIYVNIWIFCCFVLLLFFCGR